MARPHELPLAPPGARGAHAAGLDPPALPSEPLFEAPPDEAPEPEAEEAPDGAPTPAPSGASDAGVAL